MVKKSRSKRIFIAYGQRSFHHKFPPQESLFITVLLIIEHAEIPSKIPSCESECDSVAGWKRCEYYSCQLKKVKFICATLYRHVKHFSSPYTQRNENAHTLEMKWNGKNAHLFFTFVLVMHTCDARKEGWIINTIIINAWINYKF